jgi:hypothetical protein
MCEVHLQQLLHHPLLFLLHLRALRHLLEVLLSHSYALLDPLS